MMPAVNSRRHYWLRLGRLFAWTLVAALLVTPLLLGAGQVYFLTRPACLRGAPPAGLSMVAETIHFTSTENRDVSGYFIHGSNGATVVIIPAYSASAAMDMEAAALLNGAGYNVLKFDSRVCGRLGWISLGYYEVEDVLAAFDYLAGRGDVDMGRVGLYGFSSAGATAMMTAERSAIPRAVLAQGGYHNYPATIGMDAPFHPFFSLFNFGTGAMYRLLTGTSIRNLDPIGGMEQLAGKPLFLMYGSLEVSLQGAQAMLAKGQALGLDVELWVVPGADHGTYQAVAADEFAQRVVGFYQRTLATGGG